LDGDAILLDLPSAIFATIVRYGDEIPHLSEIIIIFVVYYPQKYK
jgi:hypothetical protein